MTEVLLFEKFTGTARRAGAELIDEVPVEAIHLPVERAPRSRVSQ